ncbi:hypothetical protein ACE2AJ_16715 [Aquihabitans daechungensis]|uniref:hypothetical protein n=1 Tax=Aquihabitans daechungensis TaxID=1052257 RepID=UPI003BA20086
MTTSPEHAVRRYLAWIEDPSSAVDQEAVDAAEAAFAAATDPIAKLHAAAAKERAASADVSAIEHDFVVHAKAYADAEQIPAAAFAALGVGADVLKQAGFAVSPPRGRRPSTSSSPGPIRSSGAPRAPQVSVAAIKAVAVQMPKQFTLGQLADKAGGGSPVTVRKAVDELIAEGRAAKIGPATDHQGPGRAPTVYQLT